VSDSQKKTWVSAKKRSAQKYWWMENNVDIMPKNVDIN
jgi:hypothetical protein